MRCSLLIYIFFLLNSQLYGQHGIYFDTKLDVLKWEIDAIYPPGSTGSHGDFTPEDSETFLGCALGLSYKNKIFDIGLDYFWNLGSYDLLHSIGAKLEMNLLQTFSSLRESKFEIGPLIELRRTKLYVSSWSNFIGFGAHLSFKEFQCEFTRYRVLRPYPNTSACSYNEYCGYTMWRVSLGYNFSIFQFGKKQSVKLD